MVISDYDCAVLCLPVYAVCCCKVVVAIICLIF